MREERERGIERSEKEKERERESERERERENERERVCHMCESKSMDTILICVSLSMFDCVNESESRSFVDMWCTVPKYREKRTNKNKKHRQAKDKLNVSITIIVLVLATCFGASESSPADFPPLDRR
jgi:hypothetical protein